jgi:hypothetical protein
MLNLIPTIAEWYGATEDEQRQWVKTATPEICQSLARELIDNRNQKMDYRRISAHHPDFPNISNLTIILATYLLNFGEDMVAQQHPSLERRYLLEMANPSATPQQIALLMVREDFGEGAVEQLPNWLREQRPKTLPTYLRTA